VLILCGSGGIDVKVEKLQQGERKLVDLIISTASSEQVRKKEREMEELKIKAAQVYFDKFIAIHEVLTLTQLQSLQSVLLTQQLL
jgi:hypothetical protein